MAPEQLAEGIADERSDLFSFCVALWEALVGQRPFAGSSVEELRQAMTAGPRPVPGPAHAPRFVMRQVARGLALDPGARPQSLRGLIDALRDNPRQRWLRRAAVAAFALMALTSAGLAVERARSVRQLCDGGGARIAQVWGGERRRAVESALIAASRAVAVDGAPLAASVAARIDRWAAGWSDMYRDACEATRVRNAQSEALLDARMQCLDDRLGDLRALTTALAAADAKSAPHAPDAVGALPSVNECAAGDAVRAHTRLPSDPAQRAEVEAFRQRLAEARVLFVTDKARTATALQSMLELPGAARDPQGRAKVLVLLGRAQIQLGHFDEAERGLREAAVRSLEIGDLATTTEAWITLGSDIGMHRMQIDEGLRWLDLAAALSSRLPDRSDLALDRLLTVGAVDGAGDRWQPAEASAREAVALAEKICAADDPRLARAYDLLSGVQAQTVAQLEEAAANGRRAVAVMEKAGLGSTSDWAMLAYNLALTYESMERYDETIALTERALAVNVRLLPADSPILFDDRLTLGSALVWTGRFADAEGVLSRLVPDVERHRQEMPHQIPEIWMHLAQVRSGLGHPSEAIPLFERALGDPNLYDGADRATVEIGLAQALWQRGDHVRAQKLAARARASLAKATVVSRAVVHDIESWDATHR